MALPTVMSRAEVDQATMAEIAEACDLPVTQIEDVYACVPQQLDFIAEQRSEVFHVILSFDIEADINRWCEAVRQVVLLNSLLRTRLVYCRLGIVQVVVSGDHVTERRSGDVEEYLRCEGRCTGLGAPLFRSVFIDRKFVATMHHAVMDYWSLNTFLNEDVAGAYFGYPPKKRPAYKEFVARCVAIDESAAKSFWNSRFSGVSAIFPAIHPDHSSYPSREVQRKMSLKRMGNDISPSHVPWYAEAAWALTCATYADSTVVGYGFVLSCRSSNLNGVETTLGPTVAEVPVQVNLSPNITVERLIKDRATSLRQLMSNPTFLHYGIAKIGASSEAAKTTSSFQSIFNVIPPLALNLPKTTEEETKSVSLDRIVWQARGAFSLMVFCRILDGQISVEFKYDPIVLCERQLQRVLNQFEHTLQLLTEAPLQTKLHQLQLLNSCDRSEILQWKGSIPQSVENRVHEVFGTTIDCTVWIVNLQNINELAPIGSVGELVLGGPGEVNGYPNDEEKTAPTFISPPLWAASSVREGTRFHRCGDLVKYTPDGSISFIGRRENRVKLSGQTIQLEEIEGVIGSCREVRDVVTLTKITAGHTQLAAVVCLVDRHLPKRVVLQELRGVDAELGELRLEEVRSYASSRLPSDRIPTLWLIVEQLPRTALQKLDRTAVRDWLRTLRR